MHPILNIGLRYDEDSELTPTMPLHLEQSGDDVLLWIKAVPGASRSGIAGVLGDRLKVRISAPPEAGKANKAICELLATRLGIKPRQVQIHSGHSNAEKVVRITGVTADDLVKQLTPAAD